MPTIPEFKMPPPSSWEEFERIAVSALKLRWDVTELTRYGRPGQPQRGVDFCGFVLKKLHGVQCKNMEVLPFRMVEEEVAKAEAFDPPLDAYFIVTTAAPDVGVQAAVLRMTKARLNLDKFPVSIIYWEDLFQDLNRDKTELYKHYPELKPAVGERLYCGLSFADMVRSLTSISVEHAAYLGEGVRCDLLTAFVKLQGAFEEGGVSNAAGAVPAWWRFAYELVPHLRTHGLVEPHYPYSRLSSPSFRLSDDGRAFLLRVRVSLTSS